MNIYNNHAMACDVCGNAHMTKDCQLLSHEEQKKSKLIETNENLAYKSLPSWIQVSQRPDGRLSVVTHRRLPKCTKIGPLLAPQMPYLISNDFFPLKICHYTGGETYFDVTRKSFCNWLSLIPKGSASNRNLVVCQIDDLLYYVTTEDVNEKTELRVWYGPFYYERISGDLKVLRENCNADSSLVLKKATTLNESSFPIASKQNILTNSSLACIAVGRNQLIFTYNICGDNTDSQIFPHPRELESSLVTSGVGDNTLDGFIQAAGISCRYVHKEQASEKQSYQNSYQKSIDTVASCTLKCAVPSIEIINSKDKPRESEKIVTFTISENDKSLPSSGIANGDLACDNKHSNEAHSRDLFKGESSDEEKERTLPSSLKKTTKRSYKYQKIKSEVPVADYSVVNQLPARALGAYHPQCWSCRYCGENFIKLLPFANHIKAHLLWIIGRCHQCKDCGQSYSSALLLQRHMSALHKCTELPVSLLSTENRAEMDVSVKHEVLSDEEAFDDIGLTENKQSMKKITTLPTSNTKGPHNCQICPKQFHKAEYLLRHLRKHTGDFTCQKCLKVFARKESLQKHACPNGTRQGRFECSLCNRPFSSMVLLEQHYLKHKGNKRCTRCGRFFSHIGTLKIHMKNCPSVEISTSFQCGICNKEFANQAILDRHMNNHSIQHQCEICKKVYLSRTSLRQHILLCRQIQQVISFGHVNCEDCGKVSKDAEEFRIHYQKHTHPFHCNGCNTRFRTRAGFEVHVCTLELQCDQCCAEFRSVQALNRHSAVHGPPPFTCTSCRRSYYRKESLHRHMCSFETDAAKDNNSIKPKDRNTFKCDICGTVLATRHSLTTHLKTAHGGTAAKEFMCGVCSKQFSRKDLLMEHSTVHAPPSYPCPTCKKLFKTRKSLEVHSMLHLGIKRFTCKYCNKKYHQKINLARHERSHMPRGAVKCQYCGCQCPSTEDLKAHLLSHTLVQSNAPQRQQREQEFVHNKETFNSDDAPICNGHGEVASLEQKVKYNEVKPQVDVLATTVGEMTVQPRGFASTNSVVNREGNLQVLPKGICLAVDHDYKSPPIKNADDSQIVHVPVIATDSTAEHSIINQSDAMNTSAVLVSQSLPSLSLNTQPQLSKDNVDSMELEKLPTSAEIGSNNIGLPDTYLNSNACILPENDHLKASASPTVAGITHTYHLNLDDCQVTIEKRPEDFEQEYEDLSPRSKLENRSMKCSSALVNQVAEYKQRSSVKSGTPSIEKAMVNNEQIGDIGVIASLSDKNVN